PEMELFEQVRIDLEQIQCRRIGQADGFHEAEQHEQIRQVGRLLTQRALVASRRRAVEDVGEAPLPDRQRQWPVHRPTSTRARTDTPPKSCSPASFEIPSAPRMPGMCVYCTSPLTATHR